MIELAVLALIAAVVAAFIALPRDGDATGDPGATELRARRAALLRQLREFDEDLAAGRIAADDRVAGRRALGPELRAVTEALRAQGETYSVGERRAPFAKAQDMLGPAGTGLRIGGPAGPNESDG